MDYSSPQLLAYLKEIAEICGQDPDTFTAQFQDIHPRVCALAETAAGDGNKNYWKSILDKIRSHSQSNANHPSNAVLEGVLLWFIFGLSSSGVEQFFAKTGWGFNSRRLSASPGTEEFVVKALTDLPLHNIDEIIKIAQKVWTCLYGHARDSGDKPRISKGVRMIKRDRTPLEEGMMAHTETEFIRKRRKAAADSAASSSSRGYETLLEIGADHVEQSGWSDLHTKELDFQRQKLKARTLQAVAEGVMDGGGALKAEVMQVRTKRITDQRARERKTQRDAVKLNGSTAAETLARIAGKTTYLEDGIASRADVLDAMSRFGMKRVASACNADVFVVGVPGKTGQRLALVTALRGVTHVSPDILVSRGLRGVALKWRRLVSIPRVVFVSPACHDRHKNTFNLFQEILRSCEAEGHQVQLQLGNGDLTALQTKYRNQKSRLVAIMRADELKLPVALCGVSRTCSEFKFNGHPMGITS